MAAVARGRDRSRCGRLARPHVLFSIPAFVLASTLVSLLSISPNPSLPSLSMRCLVALPTVTSPAPPALSLIPISHLRLRSCMVIPKSPLRCFAVLIAPYYICDARRTSAGVCSLIVSSLPVDRCWNS
ncbi:hypothetical protein DAEQUDRAFT_445820 [Daedalea quercina L-15889]|uniref:Uncharacterized protein n=1 Tax=Daedalea quercina L-15889 TaxID=1314783 RepID=A0A165N853_9APHY|nr:hypothetical protein DAEQUDRAFT_445820 [Daedalea quercina L-15889]